MSYPLHVISSDPSGQSSIAADSIHLHDIPGLTGTAALQVGAVDTTGAALYRFPAGFANDFHNGESVTIMFVLQGELEIGTSDGNNVVLTPGTAARFEDLEGKGHRSRTVSGDVLVLAVEVVS